MATPPSQPSHQRLQIDVQSHLDDEPEPSRADAPTLAPLRQLSPDDLQRLSDAVRQTLLYRRVTDAQIEVAVVNDAQIRDVNREHLQHDWETDVISFPYVQPNFASGNPHADNTAQIAECHGELIVSWETATREAPQTGWPPLTELLLYCVHGTLHLTGMDDISDNDRRAMRQAEQTVLAELQPPGFHNYDVDGIRASERTSETQSRATAPLRPAAITEPATSTKPNPSGETRA